jgi:hypothetical protein
MKASCVSKGQAKYYRCSIGRFEWEADGDKDDGNARIQCVNQVPCSMNVMCSLPLYDEQAWVVDEEKEGPKDCE